MKQPQVNEVVKQQALEWLTRKPRSNEEIADKMLETISCTYELTRDMRQEQLQNKVIKFLKTLINPRRNNANSNRINQKKISL